MARSSGADPKAGASGNATLLSIVALFDGLSVGLFIPVMPFLVLKEGGGPAIVTRLVAFYALATFVANPVMGRLSDRVGRGRLLSLSLLGSAVSFAGMDFTHTLVGMTGFYLVGGILSGRNAVLPALATDGLPPERHVQQLSLLAAAAAFGVAAGPLATSGITYFVAAQADQFRVALGVSGSLAAIAFLLSLGLRKATVGAAASVSRAMPVNAGGLALRLRKPLCLAFATAFAYATVMSLTGLLVHERFGWGAGQTGLILGLFALGVALARAAILNPLVKWLGMERALGVCILVAAPTLVGIALCQAPAPLVGLVGLFSIAGELAMLLPASMVSVSTPEPQRGLAMGLTVSGAALATFLSALFSGSIFQQSGSGAPFMLAAAVLALGLLALCLPAPGQIVASEGLPVTPPPGE